MEIWQILKGKYLKTLSRQVVNITCHVADKIVYSKFNKWESVWWLDVKAEMFVEIFAQRASTDLQMLNPDVYMNFKFWGCYKFRKGQTVETCADLKSEQDHWRQLFANLYVSVKNVFTYACQLSLL